MNRYILIRRLRGPAFLLLVGVLALLNQADILSWGKSWPLLSDPGGVLALAERAALAAETATGSYPCGLRIRARPYRRSTLTPAAAALAQESTAIVPAPSRLRERIPNGGQS